MTLAFRHGKKQKGLVLVPGSMFMPLQDHKERSDGWLLFHLFKATVLSMSVKSISNVLRNATLDLQMTTCDLFHGKGQNVASFQVSVGIGQSVCHPHPHHQSIPID